MKKTSQERVREREREREVSLNLVNNGLDTWFKSRFRALAIIEKLLIARQMEQEQDWSWLRD